MPTKIEWVKNPDGTQGETWNPVVGCEKVSPGCAHCYAESFARRQGVNSSYRPGEATIRCFPERLEKPLHWKKPRRVFVCSLADLWHEQVPDEFIGRVFGMMAEAYWHTFMTLTKRSDRMEDWSRGVSHYPQGDTRERPVPGWPPNVTLGVSVENNAMRWRLDHLVRTPAHARFLSLEPLLDPVNVRPWLKDAAIAQVICGGESGPQARPMHPDLPRGIRDQCVAAGVKFVFKQWGAWIHESQLPASWPHVGEAPYHQWPDESYSYRVGKKAAGATLDGREWPMDGRVPS